jgi:hypothetical protein
MFDIDLNFGSVVWNILEVFSLCFGFEARKRYELMACYPTTALVVVKALLYFISEYISREDELLS